jgi:hypothetical protein
MSARKPAKPKLKVVPPEPPPEPQIEQILPDLDVPECFEGRWDRLYRDIVHEVIAIREAATPADMSVIESIVASAQGESEAREFAAEARDEGDRDTYLKMARMAQAYGRSKALALASLGLAGDRRGASATKRKNMAATNSSAVTGAGGAGRWGGLI